MRWPGFRGTRPDMDDITRNQDIDIPTTSCYPTIRIVPQNSIFCGGRAPQTVYNDRCGGGSDSCNCCDKEVCCTKKIVLLETTMKTVFFKDFSLRDIKDSTFQRDLQSLFELWPDHKEKFVRAILVSAGVLTKGQQEQIIKELADDVKTSFPEVCMAFDVLRFLVKRLSEDDYQQDTPEALQEDLSDMEIIVDEQKALFISLVKSIKSELIPQHEKLAKRRMYAAGVLPSLRSVGTTVEIRAISEALPLGKSISEFRANIEGYVPVVSIHLSADSGTVDEFAFQVSTDELMALIDKLQAAKIEVEAFEKYIEGKVRARKE